MKSAKFIPIWMKLYLTGGAHAGREVLVGGAQIRSELEVIQARGSSWFVGHDHGSSQATVRSRRRHAFVLLDGGTVGASPRSSHHPRFHLPKKNDCTPEPLGGVRRIVVGDVVRRHERWPSNSARQWRQRLHLTSTPCPRAGTECVVHVLQVLRERPCWKFCSMPGGSEALPFVRSLYGQPSRYVWEDEFGEVHHIDQGEGGERSHAVLEAVRARLLPGERLFAFLDDVHVVTPDRVGFRAQHFCKRSCIGMPASASTWGRLRFGMPLGTGPLFAIFWRGSHKLQTQRRGCGRDLECPQKNRGAAFWALHSTWTSPLRPSLPEKSHGRT